MLDKDEFQRLESDNKRLERENKALKQGLWDEFFKAALPVCLKDASREYNRFSINAVDGHPFRPWNSFRDDAVRLAAEVADEMLKVRSLRGEVKP